MPGKIGKYRIIRTLGQGASCKVKLGFDMENSKKVAVKLFKENLDDKMKELIINEVKTMRAIQHKNLIQ